MEVAKVRLVLGMSRANVIAQVEKTGYKTLAMEPQGEMTRLAITSRNLEDSTQRMFAQFDNDGELFFRDDQLIGIQKQIGSDYISSSRDLAAAMYAVMQEIERESNSHLCAIRTMADEAKSDSPGVDGKNIMGGCEAGGGAYLSVILRWVTGEELKGNQLQVGLFKRLYR